MPLWAQTDGKAKLSTWLRLQVESITPIGGRAKAHHDNTYHTGSTSPWVTAFVRTNGEGQDLLSSYGARVCARWGDISIITIPLNYVVPLAQEAQVQRIEATACRHSVAMDSTAIHVNALPVYQGSHLSQAYTGQGVVVGVMDIGFDLTHPNFYDSKAEHYRIGALWDQLSTDTVGSNYVVGRDYKGECQLLTLQHSRDGHDQTHGTHTAGIAAGSGYQSPYRGMAWQSELCLVANATSDNEALIDSADMYKYTTATDVLGFKYIFDYADSQGKPCVINFSEGSTATLGGDDQLYAEVLEKLVGAGHIIVASAGNAGHQKNYIRKRPTDTVQGCFVYAPNGAYFSLRSSDTFTLRAQLYTNTVQPIGWSVSSAEVLARTDSTYKDTLYINGQPYVITVSAYAECYQKGKVAYDVVLNSPEGIGTRIPEAILLEGKGSEVELFRHGGYLVPRPDIDTRWQAGDGSHSVNVPSSLPCVISVGATSYRTSYLNVYGRRNNYADGRNGTRCSYSSIGPTLDGRIKPDVMAPGQNVVSSYSSFYEAAHPNARDLTSDVARFVWKGRTYAWNSNGGTSMASPVVAGAIALWLEANPRLTPQECLEVIAATASHTDTQLGYPNNWYGYGQIDVYAGLIEVLRRKDTGLHDVSLQHPLGWSCSVSDRQVLLYSDTPARAKLTLIGYTVNGQRVMQYNYPMGTSQIKVPVGDFAQGIYVLQLTASDGSVKGSFVVRL